MDIRKDMFVKILNTFGLVLKSKHKQMTDNFNSRVGKLKEKEQQSKTQISALTKEVKCLNQTIKDVKKKYRKLDELDYEYKLNSMKIGEWSTKVKEKAKFHCDCCGFRGTKSELEAHHLYPKHKHVSMMYVVDNGVCLCRRCHFDLHQEQKTEDMTHLSYLEFKRKRQK
jgi:hypothetical protein